MAAALLGVLLLEVRGVVVDIVVADDDNLLLDDATAEGGTGMGVVESSSSINGDGDVPPSFIRSTRYNPFLRATDGVDEASEKS